MIGQSGEMRALDRGRHWAMRRMGLRRRRRLRSRRRLPPVSVLPTLCTLGNLIAGFAAIFYAAREPSMHMLWRDWTPLTFAGTLVFLGMFLDAVDGSVARLTRSSSELGAQLDSLSDVVTFGVAPAFMTLQLVSRHLKDYLVIGPEADTVWGKVVWAAAAVYVCCAALRLARYNIEMGGNQVNEHSLFRGLPSPGAAGAVVSLVILHQHLLAVKFGGAPVTPGEAMTANPPLGFVQWAALGIPLIMLLCAFGMVSSIPYVHLTNRLTRGRKSFGFVVRIVIILAFAVWWFQETLAIAFTAYALSGPVKWIIYRLRHRRSGSSAPSLPS